MQICSLAFWAGATSDKDRICIPLSGAIATTFICYIWAFISTVPACTVPAICRWTAAHGSAWETNDVCFRKAWRNRGDKMFLTSVSPWKKAVIIASAASALGWNWKTWGCPWIGGLEPIGRRKIIAEGGQTSRFWGSTRSPNVQNNTDT